MKFPLSSMLFLKFTLMFLKLFFQWIVLDAESIKEICNFERWLGTWKRGAIS